MYLHWLEDVYVKAKLYSLEKQTGLQLLTPGIAVVAELPFEE